MRKKVKWTKDNCPNTEAILQKFSLGKMVEAAINEAHELRAPLWFYALRSHGLQELHGKLHFVRCVLESVAASEDTLAKETDNLLRRIRTLKFVLHIFLP